MYLSHSGYTLHTQLYCHACGWIIRLPFFSTLLCLIIICIGNILYFFQQQEGQMILIRALVWKLDVIFIQICYFVRPLQNVYLEYIFVKICSTMTDIMGFEETFSWCHVIIECFLCLYTYTEL